MKFLCVCEIPKQCLYVFLIKAHGKYFYYFTLHSKTRQQENEPLPFTMSAISSFYERKKGRVAFALY